MKNNIYIVSALFVVVLTCLTAVYAIETFTTPIIEAQQFAAIEEAKDNIFSDYSNVKYNIVCSREHENVYYDDLDIDTDCGFDDFTGDMGDYGVVEVTEVMSGSTSIGYAYWAEANGYAGTISYVIGILTDDNETVVGLEVIRHSETPGLGDKIEDEEFTEDFDGVAATVIEAGVDGVTSATPAIRPPPSE